jgi:hypothetical protein
MPEKTPKPIRSFIYRPLLHGRELLKQAQECVEKAKEALRLPRPSIFLGERHHDPPPTEEKAPVGGPRSTSRNTGSA